MSCKLKGRKTLFGIKTDLHKNKRHAGDQVCTHTLRERETHTQRDTESNQGEEEDCKYASRKTKPLLHYQHLTFGKENLNETCEAIKTLNLTSSTAVAS